MFLCQKRDEKIGVWNHTWNVAILWYNVISSYIKVGLLAMGHVDCTLVKFESTLYFKREPQEPSPATDQMFG